MRPYDLPPEIEERLREWGLFFKDRRRYLRCGSAEGRYKRMAGEDEEGWGEPAPVAQPAPKGRNWILRAIETNEAIVRLPLVQRWSITYAYAYPSLERHVVLRCVRRFSGERLTWKEYIETVDMGRLRLWATLR